MQSFSMRFSDGSNRAKRTIYARIDLMPLNDSANMLLKYEFITEAIYSKRIFRHFVVKSEEVWKPEFMASNLSIKTI